jgi:hypothetical protein
LIALDETIHDLLSDKEYEDTGVYEEYIDQAKRAIQKASRRIAKDLATLTSRLS